MGAGYTGGDLLLFNRRLKLLAPHRSLVLANFRSEQHAVTRIGRVHGTGSRIAFIGFNNKTLLEACERERGAAARGAAPRAAR